jgi:hypothetical protein
MFWLVSTVGTRAKDGFSFPLFKHWVRYYLNLGVAPTQWKVSLYAVDLDDNMAAVADWLGEQGIAPVRCIPDSPQFNIFISTDERNRIRSELPPEDWVIVVDPDEFYGYRQSVPETLAAMEASGHDALRGYFADRIAADFTLPEVTDAPLFEQFPLETSITKKITTGQSLKICAIRNRIPLILGHHHPYGVRPNYAPEWIKVHHFKWTKGLRNRVLRHLALADKRYWWRHENYALLNYLSEDERMTFRPEQVVFEPVQDGTP